MPVTAPKLTKAARDAVENLARTAGALAIRHFATVANLPVTMKGHLDLVTEADQAVEKHIVEGLRHLFPNDGVLGEEGARTNAQNGRLWVVDPIDGTANFVRGNDQWAVSIGLFADGRPQFGVLYIPVKDQLFRGGVDERATLNQLAMSEPVPFDWSRAQIGISLHPAVASTRRLTVVRHIIETLTLDFRSSGSAAITLMDLAQGYLDGYYCDGIASWDVMAALPILNSLGLADSLDWHDMSLTQPLCFACGAEEFLAAMAPFVAAPRQKKLSKAGPFGNSADDDSTKNRND